MPKPRSSIRPSAKRSPRASSPPATSPTLLDSPPAAHADGRRVRGDRTRTRILEAAVNTASRQGLNGVTIGQLADAAGVSKGHLALLFGNREQLQLATVEAAVSIFNARVRTHADAAPTARERLRRYCLGWFDYVHERVLPGGCLITAATSEFRTIPGAVRDRLIELRLKQRELLTSMIDAAAAEKTMHEPVDVQDTIHHLFAYRAAANVALLLDDTAAFAHAKDCTRKLVDRVVA